MWTELSPWAPQNLGQSQKWEEQGEVGWDPQMFVVGLHAGTSWGSQSY